MNGKKARALRKIVKETVSGNAQQKMDVYRKLKKIYTTKELLTHPVVSK